MRTLRLAAALLLLAFPAYAAIPNMEVLPGGAFALGAETYVDNIVLAANSAKTVTVPSGARFVFFASSANVYANFSGGTAAIAVSDVTDGTGSTLNPQVRYVARLSTFSVIADSSTVLTLAWYR